MINIVGRGASYKLRSKTQYPPEGSLLYPILWGWGKHGAWLSWTLKSDTSGVNCCPLLLVSGTILTQVPIWWSWLQPCKSSPREVTKVIQGHRVWRWRFLCSNPDTIENKTHPKPLSPSSSPESGLARSSLTDTRSLRKGTCSPRLGEISQGQIPSRGSCCINPDSQESCSPHQSKKGHH